MPADPYDTTKPCPSCGKWMVVRMLGTIIAGFPAKQCYEWWCRCGKREKFVVPVGRVSELEVESLWKQENGEK